MQIGVGRYAAQIGWAGMQIEVGRYSDKGGQVSQELIKLLCAYNMCMYVCVCIYLPLGTVSMCVCVCVNSWLLFKVSVTKIQSWDNILYNKLLEYS